MDYLTEESKPAETTAPAGRQVYRENERAKPAKKEFRRINRVYVALEKAGLTDAILTIPPRTKIPALYNSDGTHGPHFKWPTSVLSLQQVMWANRANAGAGVKGHFIGGLDYDGESAELGALIHRLADVYFGLSLIRGRPNSQRFLRPYRYKSDPIEKWSLTFRDKNGAEHKVEYIGDKGLWVAEGTHPSGFDYTYEGGVDLLKYGVGNLPKIDNTDCDAFKPKLIEDARALGFELVSDKSGNRAGGGGTRLSIDDPRHWAPTPELAIKALKVRPNTAENNPRRDDLVRYICAVKSALGLNREENWPDVLDWALAYEGNTEDDVRKIWDSVTQSELGYFFLAANARAHGFNEDAQSDFDDVPGMCGQSTAPAPAGTRGTPTISIKANPFTLGDPRAIPPRERLYGHHYVRRFLSATVAPGGGGKSALAIVEALAMATGKNLLGVLPAAPLRVWYWNGEDPTDELQRRVTAVCMHYGIAPDAIGDRLFINSGRDTEIILARDDRNGVKIAVPVIDALRREIRDRQIEVLILDPFVASHAVSENDNGKINAVCRQLAMLAEETNCAIELVHHVRKGTFGQGEYTVDDARGASALLAAVRSARTLNTMTKDEAARAGVDNHRSYFRVDNGKANLAPPAENSTWHRHVGVQLGNGVNIPHAGDNVGVVTAWNWPDPSEDVTAEDVRAVQAAVAAGEWREDVRSGDKWIGKAVADVLGFDAKDALGKANIKALVKSWLKDGTLKLVERRDAKRNMRNFVEVGKKVRTA
jgi:hypothetical protein